MPPAPASGHLTMATEGDALADLQAAFGQRAILVGPDTVCRITDHHDHFDDDDDDAHGHDHAHQEDSKEDQLKTELTFAQDLVGDEFVHAVGDAHIVMKLEVSDLGASKGTAEVHCTIRCALAYPETASPTLVCQDAHSQRPVLDERALTAKCQDLWEMYDKRECMVAICSWVASELLIDFGDQIKAFYEDPGNAHLLGRPADDMAGTPTDTATAPSEESATSAPTVGAARADLDAALACLPDAAPSVTCPEIVACPPVASKKSTFAAFGARVSSLEEVRLVQRTLLANKKIAGATHPTMMAYRFIQDGVQHEDRHDDGEKGAGDAMMSVLTLTKANNVCVIVTRWYGGIHLGPERFKIINKCTREALIQVGAISPDTVVGKAGRKP